MPDATVSTGVGLANVVASTVRLTWWRDNQAAVSSWLLTTGTLGTWSTSTFTQVGSTSTLGMYQVSLPDGMFASGTNVAAFLMSSTATFAPVPLIFDLSSKILGVSSITTPVTVSSGVVSVSSATIPFGVSSISTPVAASSLSVGVNVTSIVGSAAVTSAAGVFGPLAVSSLTTPVTVSAGTVRVSSATIPFGVSSLTAAALGNFFDTGALFFSTAVVSSVVYEMATNVKVGAPVSVSSISVGVNATTISDKAGYGVSSISDKTGYALTAAYDAAKTASQAGDSMALTVNERASVVDKLLGRNVAGGSDTGRLVKEALYVLRNKVDVNLGIVYATDDTTSSWAFSVSTVAGNPIQVIDPN